MVDFLNKSFWRKQFHWPIENLKISNLKEEDNYITSRITFYGVGSIPSSVIVKHYLDNNKSSSISQYKKYKQENLFYQYLQKSKFYPFPRLYYAHLNDAKRESLLIIEDLHPKFIIFKNGHTFTNYECNALINSINILSSHKINKEIISKDLNFLKKPIYTIITPLDVAYSLKKAHQYGKLSKNDFNAISANTIPFLLRVIKILDSFPLTIALENFSPTYFAMSTDHRSSILINYRHLRIGNILDNIVAIFNRSIFSDDYVQYIFRYLKSANFKNKKGLSDIDLVKINTFAHKLAYLIEYDNYEDLNLNFMSSLINYSYIVKSILSI
ncbi:MAG: hypothetical protein ACLFPS_07460 [Clostridia bacterium]